MANNVSDPLNGQLAIGKEGLVPKHPIIMPLLSIPFYFLFKNYGLLLFNVIDCMILIVLIFKLNRLFFNEYISFITAALYATGSLFLEYTYNYSPDVFSTVLVLGGLYLVLRDRFYVGAFLLGLSVFAKISNVPIAGVILLYAGFMIFMGRQTNNHAGKNSLLNAVAIIVVTAGIFVVALIPLAYTNYRLFGSPFVTGYQHTAVVGSAPGQILSVNHADKFNQPLLKGAALVLFHPYLGVIPTNPIVILAFLGVFRLRKNGNEEKQYLILAICLIQLIMFAKYDEWYTSHFSNRFLMTFIALSSVFTSSFLKYLSARFIPESN